MKRILQDQLLSIFNSCKSSIDVLEKRAIAVLNVVKQIQSLDRCNWSLFFLSEGIRDNLKISLDERLTHELFSVGRELLILESFITELQSISTKIQDECNSILKSLKSSESSYLKEKLLITPSKELLSTPNKKQSSKSKSRKKDLMKFGENSQKLSASDEVPSPVNKSFNISQSPSNFEEMEANKCVEPFIFNVYESLQGQISSLFMYVTMWNAAARIVRLKELESFGELKDIARQTSSVKGVMDKAAIFWTKELFVL